jgi:hypothetical protein
VLRQEGQCIHSTMRTLLLLMMMKMVVKCQILHTHASTLAKNPHAACVRVVWCACLRACGRVSVHTVHNIIPKNAAVICARTPKNVLHKRSRDKPLVRRTSDNQRHPRVSQPFRRLVRASGQPWVDLGDRRDPRGVDKIVVEQHNKRSDSSGCATRHKVVKIGQEIRSVFVPWEPIASSCSNVRTCSACRRVNVG